MSVMAALAQATPALGGMIVPILLLMGVLMLFGTVLMYMRRRMVRADTESAPASTLESLRQLHESGQLTRLEYDRARARLVDQIHSGLDERATSIRDAVAQRKQASRAESGLPVDARSPVDSSGSKPAGGAGSEPKVRDARPGFDLTGEPLPQPHKDSE